MTDKNITNLKLTQGVHNGRFKRTRSSASFGIKTPSDTFTTNYDSAELNKLSHFAKKIRQSQKTETIELIKASDKDNNQASDVIPKPQYNEVDVKVFLVHGSHTGGHRSAANAVKKAMDEKPKVDAQVINALDHGGGAAVKNTQVAATNLVINKLSGLRGWAFRKSFEGNPIMYWLGNTAMKIKSMLSKKFLHKIQKEKPDVIVATHSPMNSMLSHWKEQGKLGDTPIHSVVTDFRVHRMWAQKNIDQYYVASEGAKKDLVNFGIDPERIKITGIPINPDFAKPSGLPKAEMKQKLGIDPKKPMVLMMGGSLGLGKYNEMAAALNKLDTPVQMVCITGKNKEKKAELEELQKSLKMPMKVLGYAKNVNEWMEACDVIVSKAGGLTTSEVFAKGVPMIILQPKSGLEEMLIPSVTSTGGAFAVDDENEAAKTVKTLLTDKQKREETIENLKKVGKPWSAYTVANEVVKAAR